MVRLQRALVLVAVLAVAGVVVGRVWAQETPGKAADAQKSETAKADAPKAEAPKADAPKPEGDKPDAAKPEGTAEEATAPLSQQQIILTQRYKQFEKTLLQMAEFMRKTDPDRADLLVRALARSKEERISQQMEAIAKLLEKKSDKPGEDGIQYGDALTRQDDLMASLKVLLDLLQSENRLKDLEAEKARIRDLLKDTNRLIGQEQDQRAQTERGGDPKRLADGQEKVAGDAKKLIDKIDRQDAERNATGKPGEGKPGEGKPGEGKPGEGKPGEGKPGEGKPGEGKPGEGKPGEGKPGEGKPGEGKPGEGKPGEGKPGEGKPGEGKPGEGKPGEGKPGEGKPGEGKPGEGKPGEGKPGEGKPGEGKPGEGKPGEKKPNEGKPGEAKPGEAKPGEGKPGEGKPGEGKPGEGKPGKGKPGEGEPGKPGDSGKPGSQKPGDESQDDSNDDSYPKRTPGRKELEQARKEMERAIEELKKANRDKASGAQDEAIAKLREAKEKLEEILRQLREEERELLLAALEARFQKMLALQLIVYTGTVGLDKTPKAEWNIGHHDRATRLANQENEIALEAAKALELLKGEGSSIAFPEAVLQLRQDVLQVVVRLQREDVGQITQAIERDILESLEELIEALQKEMEKAKKEKEDKPKDSKGQPQDKALVDKLAELKMLRSLQQRINRRTKRIGREVETPDETVNQPDLQNQLQDLAVRQAKIQKATYDLATGKNQ